MPAMQSPLWTQANPRTSDAPSISFQSRLTPMALPQTLKSKMSMLSSRRSLNSNIKSHLRSFSLKNRM